jgi:hypothetical protein
LARCGVRRRDPSPSPSPEDEESPSLNRKEEGLNVSTDVRSLEEGVVRVSQVERDQSQDPEDDEDDPSLDPSLDANMAVRNPVDVKRNPVQRERESPNPSLDPGRESLDVSMDVRNLEERDVRVSQAERDLRVDLRRERGDLSKYLINTNYYIR